MHLSEYLLQAEVGDRIRTTTHVVRLEGGLELAIDIDADVELVRKAATPGERAYEAFQANVSNTCKPWARLGSKDKAIWENIAEAARS